MSSLYAHQKLHQKAGEKYCCVIGGKVCCCIPDPGKNLKLNLEIPRATPFIWQSHLRTAIICQLLTGKFNLKT